MIRTRPASPRSHSSPTTVILALDTATRAISLALAAEHTVPAEATWLTRNNHTAELAPAVERMLAEAGLAARDLTAIAVAIGPGSFTGVRIGLAFAKGLALAQGKPLIGVPTLEVAVRALPATGQAIAVIPAGRGRVVWARYEAAANGWQAVTTPVVADWAEVAAQVKSGLCVVGEMDTTGIGALRGAGAIIATPAQNVRRAAHLAEIAWGRWRRGEADDAATLVPVYAASPASGTAP